MIEIINLQPPPQKGDIYLAVREEGQFINAYFSRHLQPEDSILIGSIARVIMDDHPELFEHWTEFMTLVVQKTLQDVGLKVRGFYRREPTPTPEGHA